MPGRARDIAVSPKGVVFIVTANGDVARWNSETGSWDTVSGIDHAAMIAVGPHARPVDSDIDGGHLRNLHFSAEEEGSGAGPNDGDAQTEVHCYGAWSITDPSPLNFVRVRGRQVTSQSGPKAASSLAATDGQVMRWNNAKHKFLDFPGGLRRIAVSPQGLPWGITADGQVYRHDGKNWVRVFDINDGRDIAVGSEGSAFVINSNDELLKYDPDRNRFVDTHIGKAISVA